MAHATLSDARLALARHFGYQDFRAPQIPAIEAVLSGRDAVIVLPTGGGKSICFQVPALLLPRLTVVVSPLISLMADQVIGMERRGIGATFLNSTLTPEESAARIARIRTGRVKLLYVAPERLASPATVTLLAHAGVDLLAVDEAHCVSEWGQDFRPSYLRLARIRRSIGDPQMVALTATATPRVRRDITRLLGLRDPMEVVGGFDRPNLSFHVRRVASEANRNEAMLEALRATAAPAVVYAATRRQVEQVARLLVASGIRAVPYHAGLDSERRSRAQDAFMSGTQRVIVATNAFGMGIDKPDVRLVLHYFLSGSLEDYYQEAGRAGRDGAPSRCELLYHPHDRRVHDRMRLAGHLPPALIRTVWEWLARESAGKVAVTLEPERIARQVRAADASAVARALAVLEDRGAIPHSGSATRLEARLIGSPLRLACERSALSANARRLLEAMEASGCESSRWRPLEAATVGPPARIRSAARELESRQLAVFAGLVPRLVLTPTLEARRRMDRVVHEVATRHEVERRKLDAIAGYAESTTCRRGYILRYFGEGSGARSACGACDRCTAGR
ncbi:MAG: RecQ family ATP-dependent DNA helicase [Gemmatimonadaceae bacterium]|nr:RecQ family ATP-dependent DNA helicase [Gemmatimonadaceae bacterium]